MPWASSGPGTLTQLAMVGWPRAVGLSMAHVPGHGPGDVVLAFAQGPVNLLAHQPAAIRRNNLNAVAVFAPPRLPEFPGTPTLRKPAHELDFSVRQGFLAPVGAPAAILARDEARCCAPPPSGRGRSAPRRRSLHRNARDFAALVSGDAARFARMIEEGGLRQVE